MGNSLEDIATVGVDTVKSVITIGAVVVIGRVAIYLLNLVLSLTTLT